MTAPQVELYASQSLKLLGERAAMYVEVKRDRRGRVIPLSPGDSYLRLDSSSFESNEAYYKMLRNFGGRVKKK